ncbi:MAG: GntP family permease [Actinomycetia bacterium]|nr:GntP family permease [Actinomycetes bacterium]
MEPMAPAYATGWMLAITAVAVGLLLFLIIKVRLHAFISLVLVSVLTALAVQVPLGNLMDVLFYGFAGTLGAVALLVGFGAMIGKIFEVTGAAQVLADTLIARFGDKRAPLALGVASLIFGFPIYFDAGLVIFVPIILVVARRFGGSLLLYALPSAGAFAVMHALVPPHPGPVVAATVLGANVGLLLLVGTLVAIPTWFIGSYLYAMWAGHRFEVPVPAFLGDNPLEDEWKRTHRESVGPPDGGTDPSASGSSTATASPPTRQAPSFGTVVGILLIPVVLIGLNTLLDTLSQARVVNGDAAWVNTFVFIGQTPIALLITTLVAVYALGHRGRTRADVEHLLNESLGPICAIMLITGAGGMFGGVLELSGIGQSVSEALDALGLPLIFAAFIIATGLRVAQGSATVALTTTAALIGPTVAATQGLNEFDLVLLVIAIAAGATVLSHLNDSGFWLVSRFFSMDEKTTLKTWTVMETLLGVTAFLFAVVLWYVF